MEAALEQTSRTTEAKTIEQAQLRSKIAEAEKPWREKETLGKLTSIEEDFFIFQ
jgi:hypothetical protein